MKSEETDIVRREVRDKLTEEQNALIFSILFRATEDDLTGTEARLSRGQRHQRIINYLIAQTLERVSASDQKPSGRHGAGTHRTNARIIIELISLENKLFGEESAKPLKVKTLNIIKLIKETKEAVAKDNGDEDFRLDPKDRVSQQK